LRDDLSCRTPVVCEFVTRHRPLLLLNQTRSPCVRLFPHTVPAGKACTLDSRGVVRAMFHRSYPMRFTTFLRFLGLTFAFLVIPAFASAQQSITCEANNNNRKYCGSYRPDQVRLQR